jgi:ATP-dependent Clp protease ATP-binding subunit ClpX
MKRSIIFLDEIDKLRTGGGGGATRDVGGTDAQRTLLSILQGTEYSVEFERGKAEIIDTTGIQFIAGGSFAGTGGNKHELAEIIRTRLYKEKGTGKSSIGFNVDAPVEKDIDGNDRLSNEEIKAMKVEDLLPHVKDLDVMEFGILAELIGRLPSISYVLPLNEDELVSVLTLPRNALYKQYIKEFEIHGVELEFEHNALKEIARRAGKRKTGARALKGVMRTVMSELEMDVYSDEETDPAKQINHITITEDFIKGKADKPVIDRGPRKEKKAQAAKAQSNLKVADPWEDDAKPKK